jgi:hypothetical protein
MVPSYLLTMTGPLPASVCCKKPVSTNLFAVVEKDPAVGLFNEVGVDNHERFLGRGHSFQLLRDELNFERILSPTASFQFVVLTYVALQVNARREFRLDRSVADSRSRLA